MEVEFLQVGSNSVSVCLKLAFNVLKLNFLPLKAWHNLPFSLVLHSRAFSLCALTFPLGSQNKHQKWLWRCLTYACAILIFTKITNLIYYINQVDLIKCWGTFCSCKFWKNEIFFKWISIFFKREKVTRLSQMLPCFCIGDLNRFFKWLELKTESKF